MTQDNQKGLNNPPNPLSTGRVVKGAPLPPLPPGQYREEENQSKPSGDQMLVSKKQLSTILDELKNLREMVEDGARGKKVKLQPVNNLTVRIREFQDSYVVGWTRTWTERPQSPLNKSDDRRLFIELVLLPKDPLDAETTLVSVDYNEMIENSMQHTVDVVDVKIRTFTKDRGEVEVKEVKDYKTVGTGIRVEMEELYETRFFKIKLPNGRLYRLEDKYVNS